MNSDQWIKDLENAKRLLDESPSPLAPRLLYCGGCRRMREPSKMLNLALNRYGIEISCCDDCAKAARLAGRNPEIVKKLKAEIKVDSE